ncbi:hypothetical protein CY658_17480 [Variovorax sp. RO1]|nr:hypothetical protein CY658_17480 [Variovorax sp. RO1]
MVNVSLVFLPPLPGEGWGGGKRRSMKRGCVARAVVPPSQPSPGRGRSNASGSGVAWRQCSTPRYARITSSLLRTSSGVPSPIFLP